MIIPIKKYIFIIISTTFLNSCANISSPTGGPKDVTHPKINKEKSKPLPNTKNYNEKVIELTFDEDITIGDLQEQLIITPVEDNKYVYVAKKNKIRLEFEKNLTPNTTYTLNFRESIKDITEGNIAENLIIPFSTGPTIDSNYISGSVTDLKTNTPQNNILLSLYKTNDTLSPINSKPLYVAKSKNGTFIINNIKSEKYNLYAIDDKNKNMKYEESEKIAFIKNISLDSAKKNIELSITLFDNTPPVIRKTKSFTNTFEISFNEGIQSLKIKDINSKDVLYTTSGNGREVTLFNSSNYKDSIDINIEAIDSSSNTLNNKIKLYFTPEKEEKQNTLFIAYTPTDKKVNPNTAIINLLFSKPITSDSINKIYIVEDSINQKIKLENIKWINNTNLEISKDINAKDSVLLYIPNNTFYHLDIPNKGDTIKFEIKDERNYGSIAGIIKTKKENYIIELLDSKYQVKETLINPTKINFQYLEPGQYFLRAIIDENKNKKTDSGNLKESKQPEPIILFKNKIELRANWEIQDIEFEF